MNHVANLADCGRTTATTCVASCSCRPLHDNTSLSLQRFAQNTRPRGLPPQLRGNASIQLNSFHVSISDVGTTAPPRQKPALEIKPQLRHPINPVTCFPILRPARCPWCACLG